MNEQEEKENLFKKLQKGHKVKKENKSTTSQTKDNIRYC